METITTLLNTAIDEALTYTYEDLQGTSNGMCVHDGSEYFLLLDHDIKDNPILHKTVLAEELGHYFTMIDDPTPRKGDNYSRKCRIDKEEEKAARWSTNCLITDDELLDYIEEERSVRLDEIVEHFQITEKYLMMKLYHMSLKKDYYHIVDNRFLCLVNWPSAYITVFLDEKLASIAKAKYGVRK